MKVIKNFLVFILLSAAVLFVAGYFTRDCIDDDGAPRKIEKHSNLETEVK